MTLLGSILKSTGGVLGAVSECLLKGTGEIIGNVANKLEAYEVAETARNIANELGEFSNETLKVTSDITATVVDKTIDITSKLGGNVGEFIAESCSDDYELVQTAKKIGNVVGGAAAGLLIGDLVGSAVTGTIAAKGVASTGTTISTLHGAAQTSSMLAYIGGGTLSTGGGGVVLGQAVLEGINVVTTISGSVDGMKKAYDVSNQPISKQNKSFNNIDLIDDKKNKLYYSNGNLKYQGELLNGQFHGIGTLYDNNGKVLFKGIFKNGTGIKRI